MYFVMIDKSNNSKEQNASGGGLIDGLIELIKTFLLGYLLKKWGILDPITALEDCLKRKEWFKGVILSTTFFEAIGKRVLVDALEKRKEDYTLRFGIKFLKYYYCYSWLIMNGMGISVIF